jgi:hypothetical protein
MFILETKPYLHLCDNGIFVMSSVTARTLEDFTRSLVVTDNASDVPFPKWKLRPLKNGRITKMLNCF